MTSDGESVGYGALAGKGFAAVATKAGTVYYEVGVYSCGGLISRNNLKESDNVKIEIVPENNAIHLYPNKPWKMIIDETPRNPGNRSRQLI